MKRWTDWPLFAGIFSGLLLLTLLRWEDPRRDRPRRPGGVY